MRRNRNTRQTRKAISDINLTNLIDVTMVTLVIYMIIAPMTDQGIDIALPQTSPHKIEQSQEPTTVIIAKNGDIYLGTNLVTLSQLIDNLKEKAKQKKDLGVIIKADKSVDYGSVVHVLDELNNAGITQVGMATEAILKTK